MGHTTFHAAATPCVRYAGFRASPPQTYRYATQRDANTPGGKVAAAMQRKATGLGIAGFLECHAKSNKTKTGGRG